MRHLITFLILVFTNTSQSQELLTLEKCYRLVKTNYPLSKQSELLAKQNSLDLEVIKTGNLPQLDFAIQATYQSDVTHLPIALPNSNIEIPNKDQYKATLSVNQLIFANGLIKTTEEVKKASLKTKQKQVEVNLYQVKKQINQLYFSILFQQEKRVLLTSKKELLRTKLKEVTAGIKFGAVLPTSDNVLEAEILKIEQQLIETESNKNSLLASMSSLLGFPVTTKTIFENPTTLNSDSNEINRPEIDLFKLKKEEIESSEQLISKQNAPKLVSFATGGYGNPGLNMLDNSFQPFYLIGLKLNWTILDWNTNKKQRESLLINKEIIDNEQEVFELNTTIELNQQSAEIAKISEYIQSDTKIIDLHKTILKSSESQLKNGVITASSYITDLTNLTEAESNLSTHKIQLQLAQANYNTTNGN
jgi:outer membrane protein TolC